MAEESVFDVAAQLLDGHFAIEPNTRKGGLLTGYAAVKLAFGVGRDDHAVAYNGSTWPQLAADMDGAFAALDEITGESSERPVPFIVWCSRPERTQQEVQAVLKEAAKRHPEIVVNEPADLRPASPRLAGMRKLRWVVCSQLAIIAAGRRAPLSATIDSLSPRIGEDDWELIERLDRAIDNERIPWERPKQADTVVVLSRAWGTKTRNDPALSFAQFWEDFNNEMRLIPPLSDDTLHTALETYFERHRVDAGDDAAAPRIG